MVMVGSRPPSPAGGLSAALSATSTAIAPAFCAVFTLTVNTHVPRSTSAMLPKTAAALAAVSGSHASVDTPTPSCATTTLPVMPVAGIGGPNDAVPNRLPSTPGSCGATNSGRPNRSVVGTPAATLAPVQTI